MTTDRMNDLLEIADREQVESIVRAHAMLRDRCATAMMLDERELAIVFQHLGGSLQPTVAAVELQARDYIARAMELLKSVDLRLDELMAVITTPPRTAHLGRSWIQEIAHIDEMIETAQSLLEAPEWKGTAAAAHLTTVPAQIEALRSLRSQAVTAGESVIAVGALQNTIFEASALLMVAAAVQVDVQPPGQFVPAVLYRRTVALVQVLGALVEALDQQFSGEGTWKESAKELSRGLEEATSGIGFEWPKATREEKPGKREKRDDDHPGKPKSSGRPDDQDEAAAEDQPAADEGSVAEDGEEPGGDSPATGEEGSHADGAGAAEAADAPDPEPAPADEAPAEVDTEPEPADPESDDPPVGTDPEASQPDPNAQPAEPEPELGPEPVQPAPEPEPAPGPVQPTTAPVQPAPVPQPAPAPEPVDPQQAAWEEEQLVATEAAWDRIHEDRELAKDSLRPRTLMP